MAYAIELSERQSAQILEDACRDGREVLVLPRSWPGSRVIAGRLIGGPDDALEVACPCIDEDQAVSLHNQYCHVDMEHEGGQHFFDSHVLAVRGQGDEQRLVLAWPETILVKQRRRSRRTSLASSSGVQLGRQEGGQLWTCRGQLYNLSPEGLAFKIPKTEAGHMDIGQSWCACFEVPEQAHVYKLTGIICRMLPSSSEDDVIVGLNFDHADMDEEELRRLRGFLRNRQQAGVIVGGQS